MTTARRLRPEELEAIRSGADSAPFAAMTERALLSHIEALEADAEILAAKDHAAITLARALDEEARRLRAENERLREAGQFMLDYAQDIGECAVCNRSLVSSRFGSPCDKECPGAILRDALRGEENTT